MNRDKQIEIPESEMGMSGYSKLSWRLWERGLCTMSEAEQADRIMRELGYRKSTDLAREIFEEIEKEIELALDSNYRAKKEHYNHSVIPNYDNFNAMCDGKIYAMRGLLGFIAELKKKYTEEKDDA